MANGLAFAYAFVLAGFVGCFLGGVLTVGVYKGCSWFVHSSRSIYMSAAYGALLSYHALDLLNGNYLSYLILAIKNAVIFWLIGSFVVNPARAGKAPPSSIESAGHAAS